jgi:hypothetical protein
MSACLCPYRELRSITIFSWKIWTRKWAPNWKFMRGAHFTFDLTLSILLRSVVASTTLYFLVNTYSLVLAITNAAYQYDRIARLRENPVIRISRYFSLWGFRPQRLLSTSISPLSKLCHFFRDSNLEKRRFSSKTFFWEGLGDQNKRFRGLKFVGSIHQ